MYLIIVYDTEHANCIKLHKLLKKYLFGNQNSVFEGNVTYSQFIKIKNLLNETRAADSHITLYSVESEKLLRRKQLGEMKGNIYNII